jgi:hypothetical protein
MRPIGGKMRAIGGMAHACGGIRRLGRIQETLAAQREARAVANLRTYRWLAAQDPELRRLK